MTTTAFILAKTPRNLVVDSSGDLVLSADATFDTNTLYVDSNNNRVGIGTLSPTQALDVNGNIVLSGTVDGRDIATDGAKLDGVEAGATGDQTGAEIKALYEAEANTNAFTDALQTKLSGIETGADVTDTANVTAAGALMDSELTNLTAVKAINQGLSTSDSPNFAGVTVNGNAVLTTATDTSNASTLDLLDSTQFLRSDTADTKTSGDLSFADNIKAVFGTGSDLQIYHDGSNSYIDDNGTGSLFIRATNLNLQSAGGAETYMTAAANGAVAIRYNGSEKLATTSTGVDVTGTVTTDGLTNSGSSTLAANIFFDSTSGAFRFRTDAGTEKMTLRLDGDDLKLENGAGFERVRFTYGGNVGIGTTSPTGPLTVANSSNTLMALDADSNRGRLRLYRNGATAYTQLWHNGTDADWSATAGSLTLTTGGSERMRIDSSGNVGIGTTSPATALDVTGDITVSGTVDGRDIATDGTKLDTIETNADVTDTANVTAAGALMDSELTNEAAVKAINQGLTTTSNVNFTDLTLAGNLVVNGTTTTVNSNTVDIGDSIITLNADEAGTPSQNAGIEIERGTSANKTLVWDETADKWTVGSDTFIASAFEGNLTGNVTGTVSDISNHNTGDLAEGSNLYYTSVRVNSAIDTRVNKSFVDALNVDADTLDGNDSTAFATAAQGTKADSALQSSDIGSSVQAHSTVLDNTTASYTTAEETKLSGIEANATADQTASEILTAIKTVDGFGSGLDADTLDGIEASSFLRSDATDSATGIITFSNSTASTNDTTGAVIVTGGVGIGGALNVGGTITGPTTDTLLIKNSAGTTVKTIRGV